MPKRKTPEEKPEEQFKRFVETAKEHGVDKSEDDVTRAFTDLARPPRRRPAPKSSRST